MVDSLRPASDLQDAQTKSLINGVVYYTFFNLYFGIWFWVETWIAVNHSSDNYAKLLATTGLVACLINVVNIPLLWCVGIIKFLFTQIMRIIQHIQKADSEGTN